MEIRNWREKLEVTKLRFSKHKLDQPIQEDDAPNLNPETTLRIHVTTPSFTAKSETRSSAMNV